jgi:branched-chain amino acid transport system permease protein
MTGFGNQHTLIGFSLAAFLLLIYPSLINILGMGDFWVTLMLQIAIWTTLATSWNFFSGYTGYSSFGHGAFYGVGMYTTSTLMVKLGMPFLLTLPFAGIFSALAALVIGFVVFRLPQFRGELFSLLTLALTFIIATIVTNVDVIDGGRGVFLRAADTAGFAAENNIGIYYVALVIALLTTYLGYYIFQSRWGQALFAIRDDEDVADGLGVPTFQYKLWTFAVSSFCVGMIGGTQAMFVGYLEATNVFAIITPLLALMMSILGGSGVWYGPIIGAVIITSLRQLLTSGENAVINQIIIGMVLILVILFIPEGIAGRIEAWQKQRNHSQLQVQKEQSS